MMAYDLIPQSVKLMLQVSEWVLLITQIGLTVMVCQRYRNGKYTLFGTGLILVGAMLTAVHGVEYLGDLQGSKAPDLLREVLHIPWMLHIGAVAGTAVLTLLLNRAAHRLKREKMTPASAKEGMDNLPLGLCFARPDGLPILVNRTMHAINVALTGETVQSSHLLWEAIGTAAEDGVLTLDDGSHWRIDRAVTEIDGEPVEQITAADITQLHSLRKEYEQQVGLLRDMNLRLRQYSREVVEVTTAREILWTKEYVHDEMGKVLLATNRHLSGLADGENMDALLDNWRKIVCFLGRADQQITRPRTDPAQLRRTAEALGLTLVMKGEVPGENPPVRELVHIAARECLTNTARHSGGTELTVSVRREGENFIITCRDNGCAPEGEIREGGGLAAIRARAEAAGGVMKIIRDSGFRVEIVVPAERRELF